MGLFDIVFQFGINILFFHFTRLFCQLFPVILQPLELLLAIGKSGKEDVEDGYDKDLDRRRRDHPAQYRNSDGLTGYGACA